MNLLTTSCELLAFSRDNFATCRKLLVTSSEFWVTSREICAQRLVAKTNHNQQQTFHNIATAVIATIVMSLLGPPQYELCGSCVVISYSLCSRLFTRKISLSVRQSILQSLLLRQINSLVGIQTIAIKPGLSPVNTSLESERDAKFGDATVNTRSFPIVTQENSLRIRFRMKYEPGYILHAKLNATI